jgi:hypothetical protein
MYGDGSMSISIDEKRMKHLLREALADAIEDNRDMFYELIVEAIEDIGLSRAIREGLKTKTIARRRIYKVLEY